MTGAKCRRYERTANFHIILQTCGKHHGRYVPLESTLGPDSIFLFFSSVPRLHVIGVSTKGIGDMQGIYEMSEN